MWIPVTVSLSREGVVSGWAEERDMLHRMHFDVAGKLKFVCPVGDNFQDFERSYTSMVQLPAWSFRGNIFCVEPYLVSFFEGRCWRSVFVCVLPVAGLRVGHFYLQVVVNFG